MLPPLVGVAVNVTLLLVHIVVALACTLTAGVSELLTLIVIALEVLVAPPPHTLLLVTTTVTTSLLLKVDDEKVALFTPWLLPFTFHW